MDVVSWVFATPCRNKSFTEVCILQNISSETFIVDKPLGIVVSVLGLGRLRGSCGRGHS